MLTDHALLPIPLFPNTETPTGTAELAVQATLAPQEPQDQTREIGSVFLQILAIRKISSILYVILAAQQVLALTVTTCVGQYKGRSRILQVRADARTARCVWWMGNVLGLTWAYSPIKESAKKTVQIAQHASTNYRTTVSPVAGRAVLIN